MADNYSYLNKATNITAGIKPPPAGSNKTAPKNSWTRYYDLATKLNTNRNGSTAFNNPTGMSGGTGVTPAGYGDAIDAGAAKEDEAPDYSEWGAIGWGFRVITGLGRVILNSAANSIAAQGQINQVFKDGIQADEWGKLASGAWSQLMAVPTGIYEGLTYSVAPDAKSDIEKQTGGKVYDSWTQVINNDDWKAAGLGEVSEDVYWDTALGGWTAKNTLGTTMDILLDPATYFTLGIGGAVKGAARGTATAARYLTSANKSKFLEAAPLNRPRPYYAPLEKVEGKTLRTRLGNQIELDAPKYTIQDTNPYLYILKEMGRGFKEAHGVALDRWTAKAGARAFAKGLDERIAATNLDGLTPDDLVQAQGALLKIGDSYADQVLAARKAALEAEGKVTKEQLDTIMAQERARYSAILQRKMTPEGIAKTKAGAVTRALGSLEDASGGATGSAFKRTSTQQADDAVRALDGPSPIFKVKKPLSQLRASAPVARLANDIFGSLRRDDPNAEYAAWDNFRKDPNNAEALGYLDEYFLKPVGYKQTKSRNVKEGQVEAPVQGTATGRKGGGTSIPKANPNELDFIRGRQSKLQAKGRARVWSSDNEVNDWMKIRTAMGFDTTPNGLGTAAEITGDALKASGVSMSLLASRLEWASVQLAGEGGDAYKISNFASSGYNPLTAIPEPARTYNLTSTTIDKATAKRLNRETGSLELAELYRSLQSAAGVIKDKEVRGILRRMGIRGESLDAIDGRVPLDKISESLAAARMEKVIKGREAILRAIEKKQIKISIKGKPTVVTAAIAQKMTAPQVIDALKTGLRQHRLQSEIVSDAELKKVSDYLNDLREAKLKAIDNLRNNGVDIFGTEKPLLVAVTRAYTKNLGEVSRTNMETVFASEVPGQTDRLMGEFMALAYRASSHRDSIEGGIFAEVIEDLARKAGIPPLSSFKTSKELGEALKVIAANKEWTAYVTPAMLQTVIARTNSIGAARVSGAGLRADTLLKEEKRLIAKAEALLAKHEQDTIASRLAIPNYRSGKIVLPFRQGEAKDTSFLGMVDQGQQIRGRHLVADDFPEGVAAADSALNPKNIDYVHYIPATAEVQKIVNSLGVQPGIILGVLTDGKFVPAAKGQAATHVSLPGLIKTASKPLGFAGMNTPTKNLYARLLAAQYETASNRALKAIAEAEVPRLTPLALDKKALTEFIKREIRVNSTSIPRVEANLAAKFLHALDMRIVENAIDEKLFASPFARLVTRGADGAATIQTRKRTFEGLMKKLEDSVAKDFPNISKPTWDGKMSIRKVIENGNPNLFISWLKNKQVFSERDRDEWVDAMEHLRNFTQLNGGTSPWRSYKEMLASYPMRANSKLIPGQVNPATGRLVPTEAQVLQVLNALGIEDAGRLLDTKEIISRGDVLNLVRGNRKHITEQDLKNIRNQSIFDTTLIAAEREVREISDALPPDEITVDQTMHMLASFQEEMIESDNGWVIDLAAYGMGAGAGRFTDLETVLARRNGDLSRPVADIAYDDFFDRQLRANFDKTDKNARDLLKQKGIKEVFLKPNFDKENLYTSDKIIISVLSGIAESNSLVGAAREKFMMDHYKLVINARDLYLNARGIYPSSTLSSSKNEHNLIAAVMGKAFDNLNKDQQKVLGNHAIYITEGDFIKALGDDIFAEQFMQGSLDSLPITGLFSPTRALIMAMDNLPDGEWFDADQLDYLFGIMSDLMNADIKNIPRFSADGKRLPSLLNSNAQKTGSRVGQVIARLLDEDVARRVFSAHTLNASYAKKRFGYEAGIVTQPIFNGLFRLLDSEISSDGLNIEAVKNAAQELNEALELNLSGPMVEIIAKMDFNARLGARMEPMTAIFMNESSKVANAGKESTDILNIQRAASKARMETTEAFGPILFDPDLIIASAKAVERGADDDMLYEIAVNSMAERGNKLNNVRGWSLVNRVGRAFADWGMPNVRDLMNPITMNTKTISSEFAEIVAKHVTNLQVKFGDFEAQTGRNLSAEAFKVLQTIPDDIATTALNAVKKLSDEAELSAQGLPTNISKEEYSRLIDEARLLDDFMDPDDAMLKEALADLWIIHNGLLSGGADSFVSRTVAFDADFINRTIREIGVGTLRENMEVVSKETGQVIANVKEANKALRDGTAETRQVKKTDAYAFRQTKDIDSFVNIWREWDIDNPYDMYVGLNSALQKVNEVRSAAETLTSLFGFAKTEIGREEAKAAGLIELVLPKRSIPGNELLSYIPEGYYFPKAIVEELKEVSKFMTQVKHLQADGTLERAMIKLQPLQDFAKKSMTQYTPKNWVQNTIGGISANAILLGVVSPQAYSRGAAVMQSVGKELDELGIDRKSIEGMLAKLDARTAKGELKINPVNDPTAASYTVKLKNQPVEVALKDWWDMYVKAVGVVPHSQAGGVDALQELTTLRNTKVSGWKKFTGFLNRKVDQPLARVAGVRDDWLRISAFINIIQKGNWNTLEEAARFAGERVNKVHPQMQGLSAFNQKFTRNFVLFFTWRAKMLGATITGVLDKPGAALAILRAQQFMSEAQGAEFSGFGDFDDNNRLIPWYMQGSMSPTFLNEEGRQESFTFSNPVTDLLGQGSWLQALRFNNQDPIEQQLGQITTRTFQNFSTSSAPLLLSIVNDWVFEGKTQGGSPLFAGDRWTRKTIPLFVEDALTRVGWGPQQKALAIFAPDLAMKASQDGMSKEDADAENWRTVFNWLNGIKATELDTIEIRKKAVQEILARRKDQFQRDQG
jgi:hypothetical protein